MPFFNVEGKQAHDGDGDEMTNQAYPHTTAFLAKVRIWDGAQVARMSK